MRVWCRTCVVASKRPQSVCLTASGALPATALALAILMGCTKPQAPAPLKPAGKQIEGAQRTPPPGSERPVAAPQRPPAVTTQSADQSRLRQDYEAHMSQDKQTGSGAGGSSAGGVQAGRNNLSGDQPGSQAGSAGGGGSGTQAGQSGMQGQSGSDAGQGSPSGDGRAGPAQSGDKSQAGSSDAGQGQPGAPGDGKGQIDSSSGAGQIEQQGAGGGAGNQPDSRADWAGNSPSGSPTGQPAPSGQSGTGDGQGMQSQDGQAGNSGQPGAAQGTDKAAMAGQMVCPACGAIVDTNSGACPSCGAVLPAQGGQAASNEKPSLPEGLNAGWESGRQEGEATKGPPGAEAEIVAAKARESGQPVQGASPAEALRKEFADPTTQPAARMEDLPPEYQQMLKDDLSIETMPPERRQIILNYFRNLRTAAASQPVPAAP